MGRRVKVSAGYDINHAGREVADDREAA